MKVDTGSVNVQVDEKRGGPGGCDHRVPEVKLPTGAQHPGGLPDSPALGGAVHIHEGEKCGDGLEGAIGKGQCGGIHYQLDRPLRGLVQFLLAIVDGGDLPTVDQADHAFSAAAQVQNGAGQVFWEGQLHLCIPFDVSIH